MKIPIVGKDQIVDTYYPVIKNLNDEKAFQEYEDNVLKINNVFISTLAMDFPTNVSKKKRKEIDEHGRKNSLTSNTLKDLTFVIE